MQVKEIVQIVRAKQDFLKTRLNDVKNKRDTLDKVNQEIALYNKDITNKDNLIAACKLILEKITYQSKAKLEQFINYALKTIFTDRDYQVELEIKEDVKRPALTILLIENGVKQDIRDSVGGGIITTLGFLLQIYYLEIYGRNRVMFIDEGLKEISKLDKEQTNVDYLTNLLTFLKWLAKEKQYKFIIVTHDDSVREIADKVYKVKQGNVEILV